MVFLIHQIHGLCTMTRESFSEDDVKSLDTMLEKGKVSFPFDNGWYLAAFYAANGCTIFGDGTDNACQGI